MDFLPNIDGIPQEMKEHDQWVMWKLISKKGENKPRKVPYTVDNFEASTDKPTTWSTFDACIKALDTGLYHGIGFVFSCDDDYVGIDWDNVRNQETGEFDEDIYQEILLLESYAEVSQSGKGAHVICKGKKPSNNRCRSGPREMYDQGRFFVMTGQHLPETPKTINYAPVEALKAIYDKIDKPKDNLNKFPQSVISESPSMEDNEILSLLFGSAIADKFKPLWEGSTSTYPSASEADLGIANYISFYTQDESQVERLMRMSSLDRSKWDTHPTYLKNTIKKAIDGLTEKYTPVTEKRDHVTEQLIIEDIIKAYPQEVLKTAYDILYKGDPAQFIRDTFGKRHLGDESIIWSCLLAAASMFISNTRGLHVKISGDKGTGKSDAFDKCIHLLPPRFILNSSMSAKKMYYDKKATPRRINILDDDDSNEDQVNTIKKITSNFQERIKHGTVINGKSMDLEAPERQVFFINSVNGINDDQMADRFVLLDTKNDFNHLEKVADFILDSEVCRFDYSDFDVQVCRCIYDILSAKDYEILIPYAKAIKLADKTKLRNIKKFLDMIRSCCLYKVFQREEKNGVYFATLEDFERAISIYSMSADSNATQLTRKELEYLQYFIEQNNKVRYPTKNTQYPASVTIAQLVKHFGVGKTAVRNILHGKDGKSGLTSKVQINWENTDKKIDEDERQKLNSYLYYGTEDFNKYAKFAVIDMNNLQNCLSKFFEDFDKAYNDTLSPSYHQGITSEKVIDETIIEDHITNPYLHNIENSIVVDDKRDNTLSPVDISLSSREKVTPPCTEEDASASPVTLTRYQLGDIRCQGDTNLQENVFK
ncbi:hypothetical protein [Methanolobus chelungpuianus]|uniref:NrS-1 polymerase-like HBD domain-containing protein n=1 Tax=Methanolobus chelungpuianus TaxID=502115 RepID=A0AAE3HAF4_9EURY|nr:hypothetical protein [Methanolobus chelungpuianus]MCQ6962981.1 hypothetical protein [Methanolobus chelungpuianus]